MTKETMTVHKALAELKLLDDRIEKAIDEGKYCAANKHSNEKINGVLLEDYIKMIQGSYDKAMDLILRRKAMKKAVVQSNAITKVSICGREYTVAEAIELRNYGLRFEKDLIEAMNRQYSMAVAVIKQQNGKELEERADKYVTAIYGQKDKKTNTADIEKVRSDFMAANTYELVDPIHVQEKIEVLEKRTADYMAEVDAALSCSNALTEITIEY